MDEPSGRRGEWWSAGAAAGRAAPAGETPGAGDRAGGGAGAALPSLTLPKGGGAIRGLDEKVSVNQATGTATMTLGVYTSPARGAFGPSLTLTYDSGAGNGPFGLGWSVPLSSITRKTAAGLPRYDDAAGSDVFILAGGEELVPVLEAGRPRERERRIGARAFSVTAYRPRAETGFARIERWRELETGAVHWRVISRENVTSLYGQDHASRIADPADRSRVFTWLIDLAFDDRGNAIRYEYKPEDAAGVGGTASAANRVVGANRYLKRILYGNRRPYAGTVPAQWCFELVADYGEHDLERPTPHEDAPWECRPDPFSSYRSCFEIRTLRRCRRFLMFHRFEELGDEPVLVRSTDLAYEPPGRDRSLPSYSLLRSVTQTGWVATAAGGYDSARLPPVELGYVPLRIDQTQRVAGTDTLENVTGTDERLIDVDGEGLRGLLVNGGDAWYYKRNVSTWEPGGGVPSARFEPLALLAAKPAGGDFTLTDLNGEGKLCAVRLGPPEAGWFEYDADTGWSPYRELAGTASIDWDSDNLRLVDVDGDGLADVLISEDDAFAWNRWIADSGFAPAQRVPKALDEERGPEVVFADASASVFLADMSGDGLSDLVRIRNGEISYWPNLGYGRFGAKVAMDRSPVFDFSDHFDARRIRLADVDGSGTADVLYAGERTTIWLNQSGNGFTDGQVLEQAPPVDGDVEVELLDLLGTGTACLVWISPLPGDAGRLLRYVDVTGSVKPYLLSSVSNSFGAVRTIAYAPSTRFYLEDRAAGRPWLTRLPFPVHVVERIHTADRVSATSFASRYRYHHGCYDGVEREFRGFACVEAYDTDSVPAASGTGTFSSVPPHGGDELELPPVLTRSWYHTGALVDGEDLAVALRREYYAGDPRAPELGPTVLPHAGPPDELRQATRALRGRLVREEVYSLDGTPAAVHPHVVRENRYQVRRLQPPAAETFGAYYAWELEALLCHYERAPDDPRVTHKLTLAIDEWGDVTRQAAVAYPRRAGRCAFPEQALASIRYVEADLAHVADRLDAFRAGLPVETRIYELTGIEPGEDPLHDLRRMRRAVEAAAEIPYEAIASGEGPQRRLLGRARTVYRRDDLSGPLPLGTADSRAIVDRTYSLRCTAGLLAGVYGERVAAEALAGPGALVDLDGDGDWWAPSSRLLYSPDPERPDAAYAAEHFFLPQLVADAWGSLSGVGYDAYDLLPVSTRDAAGNTTAAENNYRVLHPWLLTDANRNRIGARYDALGMIVATAALGKRLAGGGEEGDHLDLTTAEPSPLDDPTTRFVYDLDAYARWAARGGREAGPPAPVWARRHTRVYHKDPHTPWREAYAFTDGFGRVALTKEQAEPGPAPVRDGEGRLVRDEAGALAIARSTQRWIGSGQVVYDNKGNKVKAYEPFFDSSHEYEDEADLVQWGVTAISRYDPLGRVVRVDFPDGTIRRIEFDAWRTITWDQNDTVLDSVWYASRADGSLGADEHDAARKAASAANTPSVADLDPLGRAFRTTSDNGSEGRYSTHVSFDIDARPLLLTDALGRPALRRVYDLAGAEIHSSSIDTGDRRLLLDAGGAPMQTWDGRGHEIRLAYDALRRPTAVHVRERGAPERLAETVIYGEGLPDAQERNLRGIAVEHRDEAGSVSTDARDFDGNVTSTTRRLLASHRDAVDWSEPVGLADETFASATTYDALGRVLTATTPDGSTTANTFNERGLIAAVHLSLEGGAPVAVVESVSYDAKGQRLSTAQGNGASTVCHYDPATFRLTRLLTTRSGGATVLQDLRYSYDPVGNVTRVADRAQQTVFFDHQAVAPGADYTYDAIYRLAHARGREHPGQGAPGWSDRARIGLPLPAPGDAQALRRYAESYEYDAVGNLVRQRHTAAGGGWTRELRYGEGAADADNRLASSSVAGDTERYRYDPHGNVTEMPHLSRLRWDWHDQLQQTAAQRVRRGTPGTTYYQYEGSRARVQKLTESRAGAVVSRRIYLGTYEIYREYGAGGEVTLERRTVHVGDGGRRVCIVESKTGGDGRVQTVWRYQYGDHLGSSILELDRRGAVISYEEYYPYGSTSFAAGRSRSEVSLKRYRYSGKERDAENGFYYYGARYYAPWLGRWTQPDPAGLVDGLNLYAFAHDNPVSWSDGDGRDCDPATASCLDPNDPHNYASLEDFRRGVRGPLSDEGIVAAWDEAHPSLTCDMPPAPPPATASPDANASASATADQPQASSAPPQASGWARWGVGSLQLVGGSVEVVGGLLGGAATCLETVGAGCVVGVMAMGHGADTFTSGIGTLWSGNISRTYTARAGTAAAEGLGASPTTAHWVGTGVDVTVGLGTSLGTGMVRQAAIEASAESGTSVTLGLLPRTFEAMPGHNVVGIQALDEGGQASSTFMHLVGAPGETVEFVAYTRNGIAVTDAATMARNGYMLTRIGITPAAAQEALGATSSLPGQLLRAGGGSAPMWSYLGPNCTTTAAQVLRAAGVSVPAYARTPVLLYAGVNYGWAPVTVVTAPVTAGVTGAASRPGGQ